VTGLHRGLRGDGGRPRRARRAAFAWLAATVLTLAAGPSLGALPAGSKPAAPRGEARVLLVTLEGPVSPVTAEAFGAALDRAEREGYRALILKIDTPGGLMTSMRDIVKRMLAAEVPVIAWVAPGGARAASAGVFITMAADVAAMAPGTNIGAASPVNLQGGMDSTMAHKATNDAAAFARTVAAQRGRNAHWADQAVRRAVAVEETEAVNLEVVDFIAGDLVDLLAKADGRTWRRGAEKHRLEVKGLPVDIIEPGLRQRFLAVIADPNVAYILMLLGFYGLMFELQNPGAILPGVVGGISLILAFLALSTLPVNYAGVALIVLAIAFFLAEIKVVSHGLLAAGGVLSLVLGSVILFQGEGVRVSWSIIGGAAITTTAFFLFVIGAGLRAQRRAVRTGWKGLVGARAVVVERVDPRGRVRVAGELWDAESSASIEVGTEVIIVGVDRLKLRVRPAAKEELT
jgi:membrane-bound serine protease (ClpP class)